MITFILKFTMKWVIMIKKIQIHYNRTMANFMSFLLITYFGTAFKLLMMYLMYIVQCSTMNRNNIILTLNNRWCVTTAFFIEQIGNMYYVDYNINIFYFMNIYIYKYCVYCIDIIWRLSTQPNLMNLSYTAVSRFKLEPPIQAQE